MSCRSSSASSAGTSFAQANCDLNEAQTLSAYHALRSEAPRNAPAPSVEEYREYLLAERRLVEIHPNLTATQRASLLARLDAALAKPPVDGRTWYALRRLRAHTQASGRALQERYAAIAARTGQPIGRVRARATKLAARVDRSLGSAPPPGYTPAAVAALRAARIPTERGTVYALHVLEAEAAAADEAAQPRTEENRRITRQALTSEAIREVGYDPDGGRLEVVFHSRPHRVYAYRNVPESVYQEMVTGSAGRAYWTHIQGQDRFRYPDAASAEADAFRRRCHRCGQFAASAHHCPAPVPPEVAARRSRAAAPAVAPAVVAAAAAEESAAPVSDPLAALRARLGNSPQAAAALNFMAAANAEHANDVGAAHAAATAASEPVVEPRNVDDLERVVTIEPLTGVSCSLPTRADLFAATLTGPVAIRCRIWGLGDEDHGGTQNYTLRGRAVFAQDDAGVMSVDTSRIVCSCEQYQRNGRCVHLDAHHTAMLRRVNPDAAAVADVAAAQAIAEEALRSNWMASKRYASEAVVRQADSAVSYTDDPAAFETAAAHAQALIAAGEHPVGYVLQDATDGMLTRESGRGFGVEIEFDLPEHWSDARRKEVLQAIADDLYDEEITAHDYQRDYGASKEDGYRDQQHRGWSFEADGSVAGEVVSPIMYDEPEAWANLARVCEIVRRHGGTATMNTGSHVHVGAGDCGADAGVLTELARLNQAHEDVIFRMGTNPFEESGEHRPLGYCRPAPEVPLAGYTAAQQAVNAHNGHETAFNLTSVSGDAGDHIEFRQWDGTLDPAVIQAQVKMSAAMVVAAKRIADEHGTVPRPREGIGAHVLRHKHRAGGPDAPWSQAERDADTASARSYIDTLFTREEDKAQMARLFAITRWQRRTPGTGTPAPF